MVAAAAVADYVVAVVSSAGFFGDYYKHVDGMLSHWLIESRSE